MPRARVGAPTKLTGSQWVALTYVHHNEDNEQDPDNGRLTTTDMRVIRSLIRHRWVEERQTRRGKRVKGTWWITEAGRRALAELPRDRYQPPIWRPWWDIRRVPHGAWVVDGHELIKSGREAVLVVCPLRGPADPVAVPATLFDAVEDLDAHFQQLPRPNCRLTQPSFPPTPVPGKPIDLDDPTEGGGPEPW